MFTARCAPCLTIAERNWKKLHFPKVLVQYGKPFQWEAMTETSRDQQQQAADYILTQIKRLYAELLERRRRR